MSVRKKIKRGSGDAIGQEGHLEKAAKEALCRCDIVLGPV